MKLLVVRFSQNLMKKLFNLVKTQRETVIFNCSDFSKIAPTNPLYIVSNENFKSSSMKYFRD